MSGQITHSWNGTVLTITSDAGTSSCDLKGDTGCRGPQGPHGIVYDADGNIIMEGFATEEYVNDLIDNIELEGYATEIFVDAAIDAALANADFEDYATKEYVDRQIVNVATGGTIDMSHYATKSYVDKAVSNGPGFVEALTENEWDGGFLLSNYQYNSTTRIEYGNKEDFPFNGETPLTVVVEYDDGLMDKITGIIGADNWNNWTTFSTLIEDESLCQRTDRITGIRTVLDGGTDMNYRCCFRILGHTSGNDTKRVVKMSVAIGTKAPGYSYINPNTIPVDGTTITIVDGKLTVIGGTELASSEEVYY